MCTQIRTSPTQVPVIFLPVFIRPSEYRKLRWSSSWLVINVLCVRMYESSECGTCFHYEIGVGPLLSPFFADLPGSVRFFKLVCVLNMHDRSVHVCTCGNALHGFPGQQSKLYKVI